MKKNDHPSAEVFAALRNEEFFDIKPKHSKSHRKTLEHKWSIAEIVEYLSRQNISKGSLKDIKSLLHAYGLASHLIHADESALKLMIDRTLRDQNELVILKASHVSRIMSDQTSLLYLCAQAICEHFQGEFDNPLKLQKSYEDTMKLGEPIQKAFESSQRDFYDRNKKPDNEGI